MKRLGDLLPDRISRLNLGRADDLQIIQELLDKKYAGRARAKSLNDGVLKITTQSASIAGDMRLRQVELIENIRIHSKVKKIIILIS